MSTDPHAIIYYGIDLGAVAKEEFRTVDYDYHAMNDAYERLRAYEATEEHVTIRWFGAEDCKRYVVHCEPLEKRVEWDKQIDLGFGPLPQHPEADEWIAKFCKQFKLPFKQPTWHLAALYF